MLTKRELLERIRDLERQQNSFQDDVVFCRNFEIYPPPEPDDQRPGGFYHPPADRVAVKQVVGMLLDHLGLEIQPDRVTTTREPAALIPKKEKGETSV